MLSPQQNYNVANTYGPQQILNLLIAFFLLFQFMNVPHFPLGFLYKWNFYIPKAL